MKPGQENIKVDDNVIALVDEWKDGRKCDVGRCVGQG